MRLRNSPYLELILALLVWAGVTAVYLADTGVVTITDSRWTLYLAISLVRSHDLNLDEYQAVMHPDDEYTLYRTPSHIYSTFPLGTPLLAVPYMAVLDRLAPQLWGIDLYEYALTAKFDAFFSWLEVVWASVIAGATAALIFVLGCHAAQTQARAHTEVRPYGQARLVNPKSYGRALLLAGVFAFGTPAWSTASRALWQHGPSMLLLALALVLAVLARERPHLIRWLGVPLACAYVVRPTNFIALVCFTVYVLVRYRAEFLAFALGVVAVLAPFAWTNQSVYGAWLPPYYLPQRLASHAHMAEALAGNLVSPGRGLFVYSPIFLLCGLGVWLLVRRRAFGLLEITLAAILLAHWLAISAFAHWWGGHAYGPRFFTDMLPLLTYFLIPVIWALPPRADTERVHTGVRPYGVLLVLLFGVLALASVGIHYRGATDPAGWRWNWPIGELVADIDDNPGRLWDWTDPAFLRGLAAARLAVDPAELRLSGGQEGRVTVYNLGDGALAWTAAGSPGMRLRTGDAAGQTVDGGAPLTTHAPQALFVTVEPGAGARRDYGDGDGAGWAARGGWAGGGAGGDRVGWDGIGGILEFGQCNREWWGPVRMRCVSVETEREAGHGQQE